MGDKEIQGLRLSGRLRWGLLLVLTPIIVFLSGQAAWMVQDRGVDVDIRSALTADYSPWTTAYFPGLDPEILLAALNDRQAHGLDTRRAIRCFLLTSGCEIATPAVAFEMEVSEATSETLRIATNLAITQVDSHGITIQPGEEIILDLAATPIEVSGEEASGAELLVYFLDGRPVDAVLQYLEISLAMTSDSVWRAIGEGGDQMHGDRSFDLAYSKEGEGTRHDLNPVPSSEDASAQGLSDAAIVVNVQGIAPGLYRWLRIGIGSEAEKPVGIDAIVLLGSFE